MKKINFIFFNSLIFLFLSCNAICQTSSELLFHIDSLEKAASRTNEDSVKADLLNVIAWNYIPIDINKSISFCNSAITLCQSLNYKKGLGRAYAILGTISYEKGNYQKALEYWISALKIREETGDLWGVAGMYGNIGNLYYHMNQFNKAMEYQQKSLTLFLKIDKENPSKDNKFSIGLCLMDIGGLYKDKKQYDSAMFNFQEALAIYEKDGYMPYVIACMNEIGAILFLMKKNKEAHFYHQRVLSVSKEIGDKKSESVAYYFIASIYLSENNFEQAIDFATKSLSISKEFGNLQDMSLSYQILAKAYQSKNDFAKAFEFFKLHSQIKDSIFNLENSNQIAEMQTKYETEKKEQEIAIQKVELEKKDVESKKQKIIIASVAAGLFLVILLAGIIFRSLQITKKQKHIIEIQKDEVTRQKQEVEQQKTIVEKQKEEISHKNKDLTDSINYAQRIQQAILTSEQYLNDMFLPEKQNASHFILYKPKDIVAGDFYWAYKTPDGKAIWITADCTGHGVPGAFMSMIGNSLLNEIVVEKKFYEPHEILNNLRAGIIKSLGQGVSVEDKRKDGMDAAVCIWDKANNILKFAGANNSLWLIRNSEFSEIAPDIQPVGHYGEYAKPFTQKEIQLQKGDTLYTFTDGYCDQFGGPKGKKFKYKPFKELLLSIQEKTMTEQRKTLNYTIDEWKKGLEQIDDICVMGVRV